MASKIDWSTLTLNEQEAQSASEMIFEQTYARPEIADTHGIQTDVEMDKRIPIVGQFGLVGKVDPGTCGVNTNTGQIPTSQKTWTPKLISDRLIHCESNLPALLKVWKRNRIALNSWEGIDNEAKAFIEDRTKEAMTQAILRLADFGDTAAAHVGDGGYLTEGTDITYFTPFSGLWKQIFTDQALGTPLISARYTINENAGGDKATQLALAADRALAIFRYLYDNIDPRAFNGQTLAFQVTRSLFNNWQAYMEDKSLVFQLDRTEQGSTKFSYRGIPIVVRHDWERFIRTYHDLSTTYYIPHRAILGDINNFPIGTSDSESLTSLDSFYDKVTKSHYIDLAFKLDCKILQEELMAVAY